MPIKEIAIILIGCYCCSFIIAPLLHDPRIDKIKKEAKDSEKLWMADIQLSED